MCYINILCLGTSDNFYDNFITEQLNTSWLTCCKNNQNEKSRKFQSLSLCWSSRTQVMRLAQNGPSAGWEKKAGTEKKSAHLGSYVHKGSWCNTGHPMDVCVTRSHSFGLPIDRAQWRKDMFVCLQHQNQHFSYLLHKPYHHEEGSYEYPWYTKISH